MIHRVASWVQRPSPYPPAESNTQDLICRDRGSQPILSVTVIAGFPCTCIVKSRSRKLPSLDQPECTWTTASSLSSSQSPTSHCSGSRRSWGDSVISWSSLTHEYCHLP